MVEPGKAVWHCVAKRSELAPDEPVAVMVDGREIALFDVDGTVYATDNICTHEYACLSDGYVEGDQIECPLHQARFHIPSGRALTPPAETDLRVYRVKIEGDDIYIGLAD